jgi:hypothetical protein
MLQRNARRKNELGHAMMAPGASGQDHTPLVDAPSRQNVETQRTVDKPVEPNISLQV